MQVQEVGMPEIVPARAMTYLAQKPAIVWREGGGGLQEPMQIVP